MTSGQRTRDTGDDAPVTIDCDTCEVRDIACGDCVVSVLIGAPAQWDEEERRALSVLADSGLVPPLRLVPGGASAPSAGRGGRGRRGGRGQEAHPDAATG
ncbi:MAG: hypothetical protein RLZ55_1116 [Actinomycetota bacterium]|jgi:hypothetical protein